MSYPSWTEGLYYLGGILTTVVAIVILAVWEEQHMKKARKRFK